MEEKIQTKHPQAKKTWKISRKKYDIIRKLILECVAKKESTYTDMVGYIKQKLKNRFEGSVNWYAEVVKLDLEARGSIIRIPNTAPQLYRINPMMIKSFWLL